MIAAPAGVSQEVVDFYANAFKQAMEDPEYLEASASFTTDYKDPEASAALFAQQQEFTESLSEGFWPDIDY